jgi:hypothetical protein
LTGVKSARNSVVPPARISKDWLNFSGASPGVGQRRVDHLADL